MSHDTSFIHGKTLNITPSITKTDYSLVFKEKKIPRIVFFVILVVLPFVVFLCSAVCAIFGVENQYMFLIINFSLLFSHFGYIVYGLRIEPPETKQLTLTRVSFPTDYFTTTSKNTIFGFKHYSHLSKKGDKEIPQDLKERLVLGSIPWEVAKFIDSGSGDILFDLGSDGRIQTMNTKHVIYKKSKWVGTINGEPLPVDSQGVYILPDSILTTWEKLENKQ